MAGGKINNKLITNSSENSDSTENTVLERNVNKLFPLYRERGRGKRPRIEKVGVSCSNHSKLLTNDLRKRITLSIFRL